MLPYESPKVNHKQNESSSTRKTVERLREYRASGKEIPYRLRKATCCKIADAFECLGNEHSGRAARMRGCGVFLDFEMTRRGNQVGKRLVRGSFCKERLCPVCQHARSGRLHQQLLQVTRAAVERYPRDMGLMLTLTAKNVPAARLGAAIDHLKAGLRRMFRHQRMKAAARGWYWSLEVSYNGKTKQFHPHIHVFALMRPEYSAKGSPLYFDQSKDFQFSRFWGQMLQVDYIPIADIRPLRGIGRGKLVQEGLKSLYEVTKYCVKPDEVFGTNEADGVELVQALHDGLRGVTVYGFGGEFRKLRAELKLSDDTIDADMTEAGDALPEGTEVLGTARFLYDRILRDYVLVKAWAVDGREVSQDEYRQWVRAGPGG